MCPEQNLLFLNLSLLTSVKCSTPELHPLLICSLQNGNNSHVCCWLLCRVCEMFCKKLLACNRQSVLLLWTSEMRLLLTLAFACTILNFRTCLVLQIKKSSDTSNSMWFNLICFSAYWKIDWNFEGNDYIFFTYTHYENLAYSKHSETECKM
jgi:hypothetical protein